MPGLRLYLVAADQEGISMPAERIFENTWKVEDEGVRFFILAGTRRALVIDTGRSGLDVQAAAKSVTDLPFTLLIVARIEFPRHSHGKAVERSVHHVVLTYDELVPHLLTVRAVLLYEIRLYFSRSESPPPHMYVP